MEQTLTRPGALQVLGIWAKHLTSFYIPGITLAFLWTGPHAWYEAPLFMIPLVAAFALDTSTWRERRQPLADLPAAPFDALVYALAALHCLIVFETVRFFSVQDVFSVDMVMVVVIVGANSGFSIITAHELIHRKKAWEQQLGRLLLCTVLYEHFYTEHLRGHHARVGTPEDPATARFGESYPTFFRRTVPAQFRSAWRLEARRLGDPDMKFWDLRMLRNRILHGIALGWGMAFAALYFFGFAAFVAFLLQAWMAVRLLEAVNYFEHWGLVRRRASVTPLDSWDTHSGFTYYALTGLSRHADHHAYPTRPFQQLRVFEEAPILPAGYVGTVDAVMGKNEEFMRAATLELGRRGLGPFAEPVTEAEALAALEKAQRELNRPPRLDALGRALGRWLAPYPLALRVGGILGVLALVTALAAHWEQGAEQLGFAARFAQHAWIWASFGLVIPARRWLEESAVGALASWVFAFVAIGLLGVAGDRIW